MLEYDTILYPLRMDIYAYCVILILVPEMLFLFLKKKKKLLKVTVISVNDLQMFKN